MAKPNKAKGKPNPSSLPPSSPDPEAQAPAEIEEENNSQAPTTSEPRPGEARQEQEGENMAGAPAVANLGNSGGPMQDHNSPNPNPPLHTAQPQPSTSLPTSVMADTLIQQMIRGCVERTLIPSDREKEQRGEGSERAVGEMGGREEKKVQKEKEIPFIVILFISIPIRLLLVLLF